MSSSGAKSVYRVWFMRLLFISVGLILIGRLFYLQVVEDRYKILADDQAIVRKVIYPSRGTIIDRKGVELVVNDVAYDLGVTPNKIKNLDTALFCSIMELDVRSFENAIKRHTLRHGYHRMNIFIAGLSEAQNARLQENLYLFDGFEIVERSKRIYPKPIAALTFGYINEISPSRLEDPRYLSYRQGDYVGINGLESVYEEVLRGQRGVQYLVRDVMNRPREAYLNGELDTPAIGGKTLELYMDAELQELGEKLMEGKMGGVVAIDPKTGGILAMVSSPGFDPNLLSGSDFAKNYSQLLNDYRRPLFNKATQATYPPGSTFKPITALAALDFGVINPDFGLGCGGGYGRCGRFIKCTNKRAGHASNLRNAMAYSCNSYFMHLFRLCVDASSWEGGVKEGIHQWHNFLNDFGFGRTLGIDITSEYRGNNPDTPYFNSIYNYNWNSCNMVVVGMGQGEITVTTLQLANAMAIIANRGYYYTPHFVKSIGGNPNDILLAPYLIRHQAAEVSETGFRSVIDGMEDVVLRGTGKMAQLEGIEVCAKTGTAENYAMLNGKLQKLDNHSVFVCFAPKDDPKIAIAALVQNSGYGGTWAGPVASLMMEYYLTDTIKRTAVKDRMTNAVTIKPYIKTLDSMQRAKDRDRELIRTADKRTRDSIKKQRDTALVKRILKEYYDID